MNESILMVVLRLVHIFSGVFWAGTIAVLVWFVLPAQTVLGQAAGQFMMELMLKRRLRVYLMTAMILTILSGIALYVHLSMSSNGSFAASTMGKVLGIGALAAIIAGAYGGASGSKTAKKMAAIGASIQAAGGKPTEAQVAEMAAAGAHAAKALRTVAWLLIITIAAMASARYL